MPASILKAKKVKNEKLIYKNTMASMGHHCRHGDCSSFYVCLCVCVCVCVCAGVGGGGATKVNCVVFSLIF